MRDNPPEQLDKPFLAKKQEAFEGAEAGKIEVFQLRCEGKAERRRLKRNGAVKVANC